MFQYHIDSLRQTVYKLVHDRIKPPETVIIKFEQAEYLGVPWVGRKAHVTERRSSGLHVPAGHACLVKVRLLDLYKALETAEGVERKRKAEGPGGGTGQAQDPDADHGQTTATA